MWLKILPSALYNLLTWWWSWPHSGYRYSTWVPLRSFCLESSSCGCRVCVQMYWLPLLSKNMRHTFKSDIKTVCHYFCLSEMCQTGDADVALWHPLKRVMMVNKQWMETRLTLSDTIFCLQSWLSEAFLNAVWRRCFPPTWIWHFFLRLSCRRKTANNSFCCQCF